jgi:hypothetical protein
LNDPERDSSDLHHLIAVQLRVLLCDKDLPVLLTYAKDNNIDLRVWGPFPRGFTIDPNKVAMMFNALVASYYPVFGGHELVIEDYLDTIVGYIPKIDKESNNAIGTLTYTPKQIIKWLANKEGGAHLDLKPNSTLESIKSAIIVEGSVVGFDKSDNIMERVAVIQLAEWTLLAIKEVLSRTPLIANKS